MLQHCDADLVDKPLHFTRYLVMDKEYVVDVTHIRLFYFDPTCYTAKHRDQGYGRDDGGYDSAIRLLGSSG